MRVICPSCAAEYDVDDALIPAAGREVECAACGHSWHQPGPRMVLRPQADADDAPLPPPVASAARPAPAASAAALAILREEAERELQARAAERPGAAVGAQAASATGREAPRAEPTPPQPEFIEAELVDDAAPLPDPRAMAAGLRGPAPQVVAPAAAAAAQRAGRSARRRGNGAYNAGFGIVLALSLLAIGAYVAAPMQQDQGRAGDALREYRAAVDQGRIWLHDHAVPPTDRAIAAIREFIER